MRALIQRTSRTTLTINSELFSEINFGLTILLGIAPDDDNTDIDYLINKISNLRIFDDENGVMNRSIIDINGDILVVSQFTLMADTKKGNRPSYIKAARPEIATPLYEKFIEKANSIDGINKVATGKFGNEMSINLTNEGPVTIWIDSKNR